MSSAIDFMHNFGEMPLLADQPLDGLVEHHRKPLGIAPHHHPLHQNLIVKIENREFEFNGLAIGNSPPGTDEDAGGAYIFDDFPEYTLFDGVFRNNEGRPTGKSAQVLIGW